MRVPLSWLREWVDWPRDWDARELAARLTLAGFEIDAIQMAAPPFSGVVVARILTAERHPHSDKLSVCRVLAGGDDTALQIVCGAANARAGLVTALASIGARLPGAVTIGAAVKGGVESMGMLCSARELGLSEGSEGILELPPEASPGADLREYLDLDDAVLEVNVTANRGDAMSILGIAREVAALSGAVLKAPDRSTDDTRAVRPVCDPTAKIAVSIESGSGAGRFLAAVLRGIDNDRQSPHWLRERLRRAGLRSISAVVDVTNYVMLELGQPLHAYDLDKLHGGLAARRARAGEPLQLLDGRDITLDTDVLVIADQQGAVGLAGVMGGAGSAIGRDSRDIVLEAAWFAPTAIIGRARRYGLTTDASQRFERGVDWCGQERSLERAMRLILQIAGGTAGAPIIVESPRELPRLPTVPLRAQQVHRLLGVPVAPAEIERRLRALNMTVKSGAHAEQQGQAWIVQPPSWRFDIGIEPDLIEEVARLGGFDAIIESDAEIPIVPRRPASHEVDERGVMRAIAARGYQQIISYAFVDPALQRQLVDGQQPIELANPIASDLAVMRGSLWPGLINAARENVRRQQSRVRLFEIATRFLSTPEGYREQKMLAALALGTRLPEQWGSAATPIDFYDVKADLASLLALAGEGDEISFVPTTMSSLHPGRSAGVLRAGKPIGVIGQLHPTTARALDLADSPILFELDYAGAFRTGLAQFQEISRFPRIRRDISVTVPEQVTFASVRERVSVAAATLLKELRVFDVYEGEGVEPGRKSLALGLILQDLSRTLTDEDADRVVREVLDDLHKNLDARIRQ